MASSADDGNLERKPCGDAGDDGGAAAMTGVRRRWSAGDLGADEIRALPQISIWE